MARNTMIAAALAGLTTALWMGVVAPGQVAAQTQEIQSKVNARLAEKRVEQALQAQARAEKELAKVRDELTAVQARLDAERARARRLAAEARRQRDQARAAVEETLAETERLLGASRMPAAEKALAKAERLLQAGRVPPAQGKPTDDQGSHGPRTGTGLPESIQAAVKQLDERQAAVSQEYKRHRNQLLVQLRDMDAQAQKELARIADQRAALLARAKEASSQASVATQGPGNKLDRILERLDRIEKRLDRLEKNPFRAMPGYGPGKIPAPSPKRGPNDPFFERK